MPQPTSAARHDDSAPTLQNSPPRTGIAPQPIKLPTTLLDIHSTQSNPKPYTILSTYASDISVSTVAGQNYLLSPSNSRYGGFADGPIETARLGTPYGVAVDNSGNIIFTDIEDNRIRSISKSGVVSTLAGDGIFDPAYPIGSFGYQDGPASSAKFASPAGIEVDKAGNIIIADWTTHRIRKLSPNGSVSTVAGYAEPVESQDGYLLVPGGYVDGPGSTARFRNPSDVALSQTGDIYVTDSYNNCIRRIDSNGVVSTFAGVGSQSGGFADGASSNAKFNEPRGIATDNSGNLYVTDAQNNRIRKITPDGVVSTIAGTGASGSTDGPGNTARFSFPVGIVLDGEGNLIVCDAGGQRVRRITLPSGEVTTLAGTGITGYEDGAGSTAKFSTPFQLAYDKQSNSVLVSDLYNYRIRKIALGSHLGLTVGDPPSPSGAFSPNGDHIKDDIRLNVTAPNNLEWKITVPSPVDPSKTLVVKNGTGNTTDQTAPWNGSCKDTQGNSIILKDGKYTLRLTPQGATPSPSDPTANVIIDTTKPTITEVIIPQIDNINDGDKSKSIYTVSIKANDGSSDSSSGIDAREISVNFINASFSKSGSDPNINGDTFDVKYEFISAPKSSNRLLYSVQVKDKAGNSSDVVKKDFFATAEESFSIADKVDSTAAYSLLAASGAKPRLNNDYVFYVKSGLIGDAAYRYHLVAFGGEYFIRGTRDVFIVNESKSSPAFGTDYQKFTVHYGGDNKVEQHFDWNGHHYDDKDQQGHPSYAPTGLYTVSAYKGDEFKQLVEKVKDANPHWISFNNKHEIEIDRDKFKVSDRPCIKLNDWQAAPIGDMVFQRAYHIIDRHILVGPGGNLPPGTTRRGTPDKRHFGYYTNSLLDFRPAGFPNANNEIRNNFPFTRSYMTTPIYGSVLRMATATWGFPREAGDNPAWLTAAFSADPNNPSSYAPVVFPEPPGSAEANKVVWVYVSRPYLGQPLYEQHYKNDPRYPNHLFHNVFPFFKAQEDYEAHIK